MSLYLDALVCWKRYLMFIYIFFHTKANNQRGINIISKIFDHNQVLNHFKYKCIGFIGELTVVCFASSGKYQGNKINK